MAENSSKQGGIGFIGMLTILFIGLKLGEVITWSWWWVLSPVWITAVILFLLLTAIAIIHLLLENKKK
jgi:hypothetical protein